MKNIHNKSITICIILLLVGVSISSAISVNNKPVVSQDGECSECEKSNSDICDLLWDLFNFLFYRIHFIGEIFNLFLDNELISGIGYLYSITADFRQLGYMFLGAIFGCDWLIPNYPAEEEL